MSCGTATMTFVEVVQKSWGGHNDCVLQKLSSNDLH